MGKPRYSARWLRCGVAVHLPPLTAIGLHEPLHQLPAFVLGVELPRSTLPVSESPDLATTCQRISRASHTSRRVSRPTCHSTSAPPGLSPLG